MNELIEKVKQGLQRHKGSCKGEFTCPYWSEERCSDCLCRDALSVIEQLEAKVPKNGKWESVDDWHDDNVYRCSVCNEEWTLIEGTPFVNGMKYCPHCGAEMEVEGNG